MADRFRFHFDEASETLFLIRGERVFYVPPDLLQRFSDSAGGAKLSAFVAELSSAASPWWSALEVEQLSETAKLARDYFREDVSGSAGLAMQ